MFFLSPDNHVPILGEGRGIHLAAACRMAGVIQVFTTVDGKDAAQQIARAVVESRVAACAQVSGPITSTYWWQGQVETAEEWLCIIKTTDELYPSLEEAIREHHPYDVPEILALPVSAGYSAYIDWLRGEVGR